ncbi:MAG: CoA-binding protein, partial [Synergistales bacterium]|nr:CoA-binding protein [Synergistales bacterium]
MSAIPSLDKLFKPERIAIVGASHNMDSISGRPLKLLQQNAFPGAIYPVNPKYGEIGGLPCYPDIPSLPETPDVVLIGVRASLVPGVIEQCADRGVGYAAIFASGFAESGGEGIQEEMAARAREKGLRILGPNCQGLVNLVDCVPLTFSAAMEQRRCPLGNVAYVSQSGAFGFASFSMGVDRGVRFRYVVTTGNQSDLDAIDVARYLLQDPEVHYLLLYLEGLREGHRFFELIAEAHRRGVPIGVLKAGVSATSKEAAKSHTGALAGDEAVWNALYRQFGVLPL